MDSFKDLDNIFGKIQKNDSKQLFDELDSLTIDEIGKDIKVELKHVKNKQFKSSKNESQMSEKRLLPIH